MLCGNPMGIQPAQVMGAQDNQTSVLLPRKVSQCIQPGMSAGRPPCIFFLLVCWEGLKWGHWAHVSERSTGLNGSTIVVVRPWQAPTQYSLYCVCGPTHSYWPGSMRRHMPPTPAPSPIMSGDQILLLFFHFFCQVCTIDNASFVHIHYEMWQWHELKQYNENKLSLNRFYTPECKY